MENKKYVYVVLSQTPTKFGRLIRNRTNTKYNHASISFDENMEQLYSFGRAQHSVPVKAGLVKEFRERFSLNQIDYVACKVYKIPVSKEDYYHGLEIVNDIMSDPDGYLYNLFSVLTYPMFHGFSTYKTFTCVEFTAHMLKCMNVKWKSNRPDCKYMPEQLGEELEEWYHYEGNLLDVLEPSPEESEFYFEKPNYFTKTWISIWVLLRLGYRKMRYL
ncbi:MAG: hypothetical protein IJW18_04955 [Lachnospiraceae bacterium]|nr:hypothetical protein [Lachnospiraceae bacterium]